MTACRCRALLSGPPLNAKIETEADSSESVGPSTPIYLCSVFLTLKYYPQTYIFSERLPVHSYFPHMGLEYE